MRIMLTFMLVVFATTLSFSQSKKNDLQKFIIAPSVKSKTKTDLLLNSNESIRKVQTTKQTSSKKQVSIKKNLFNSSTSIKTSKKSQPKFKGMTAIQSDFPEVTDYGMLKKLAALKSSDLKKYNECKRLTKNSPAKRRK